LQVGREVAGVEEQLGLSLARQRACVDKIHSESRCASVLPSDRLPARLQPTSTSTGRSSCLVHGDVSRVSCVGSLLCIAGDSRQLHLELTLRGGCCTGATRTREQWKQGDGDGANPWKRGRGVKAVALRSARMVMADLICIVARHVAI